MDANPNPTPEPKPGIRTTEFWMTLAVILLGCLGPAGLLADLDDTWARLAGYGLAVLAAMGYTLQRVRLKWGAEEPPAPQAPAPSSPPAAPTPPAAPSPPAAPTEGEPPADRPAA